MKNAEEITKKMAKRVSAYSNIEDGWSKELEALITNEAFGAFDAHGRPKN